MIVVTGANGFVGGALVRRLLLDGHEVRGIARRGGELPGIPAACLVGIGEFTPQTNWRTAMAGARVVVHCAARVHVMRDRAEDPLTAFRRINVDVTESLARAAAAAGVRRMIFLSSIKVNGESTAPGRPFSACDQPAPADPYGISKWEAEQALWRISAETGLEVAIIRPPLVYGNGVRANFRMMMRLVGMGIPLPLGAIDNRRSLVALENLVDLIVTCLDHPAANRGTFLVSDGEDLSTTDLLQRLGGALHRPTRLVRVPAGWLLALGRLAGRGDLVQRVCGSLQVDLNPTRERLGWHPPLSVHDALARLAEPMRIERR